MRGAARLGRGARRLKNGRGRDKLSCRERSREEVVSFIK